MRVSAIVVSYNVSALLNACLRSLESARRRGEVDELIVVDSSSSDGSAAMVRREFPHAKLITVENRGYGAAANRGYALATGELFLTLNPDTVVSPGTIPQLTEALLKNDSTGLVGPELRYPDGTLQPSRRRFPTRWTPLFESTLFEEVFPENRWVRRYRMTANPEPESGPVFADWLVGAAFMVRRKVVEETGGFDESFFLYGEELEWCYRIRHHGWKIQYVPDAIVIHHEAASTSQEEAGSRLRFDQGRARAQAAIFGPAVAKRTARLLRINYALMFGREWLKWLVGHRRDLRRQRMHTYLKLLRSTIYE